MKDLSFQNIDEELPGLKTVTVFPLCSNEEFMEELMEFKSILIKDTTKEEREMIVKNSMDCGGGCENCSSCWLGSIFYEN